MQDPGDHEVAVFGAALQLPAGERAAYLDEACATDKALRQRVEALLADHDEAGAFLGEHVVEAQRLASGVILNEADIGTPAGIQSEKVGDCIGRYKLLQQIGAGGCGVVYMAEQQEPLRRLVALKVIKLGMDTRSVIARFEAERQALALMDHPCIAKVLDAGATEAGRPFFVMELVRGVKITEFCDQNRFDTRRRLDLFVHVCQAIQHAHQKGVIHRDIKPSNILVTINDGVAIPKVIDFGIAKATQGKLTNLTLFTEFDKFVGTPAYMSPEQAAMTSLDIDTRSDIYSLGVLLYELLTGNTPFDTQELLRAGLDEMRRAIREREPDRPSTRLCRIPLVELTKLADRRQIDAPRLMHVLRGDLDWIVMKALEKDRTRRYETSNGLAQDVQRYLAGEPVVARPPSQFYRFRKLIQRHKLAFAAGFVLAVSLLSALTIVTMAAFRIQAAKEDATEKLRMAYLAEAQALRASGQPQQRSASLETIRKAAAIQPSLAARNEAIADLALSDMREDRQITVTGYSRNELVHVDLQTQWCAAQNKAGNIVIQSVSNKSTLAELSAPGFVLETINKFSPNSRYIHARYWHRREGSIPARVTEWVWDIIQKRPALRIAGQEISPPGTMIDYGTQFDAASQLFVCSHPDGAMSVYDLASGEELHRFNAGRPFSYVAIDDEKRRVACCRLDDTGIEVRDVESGGKMATLACPSHVMTAAWSHDGKLLAAGCADFNVYVLETDSGRRRASLEGATSSITSLAFNHAGDLLAGASFDDIIRLWNPNNGRMVANYPGSSWGLRFSEDDSHLLGWQHYARYGSLQVTHNRECQLLYVPRDGGDVTGPEYSPDGRLLAAGTVHHVQFWDASSGREIGSFGLEGCDAHIFQPDGRNLITVDRSSGVNLRSLERVDKADSLTYRLGRPQRLLEMSQARDAALSRDGRRLAVTREPAAESVVIDLQDPSAKPVVLKPHPLVDRIAISPDGRWVATASYHNSMVKVWDGQTGDLLRTLPAPSRSVVTFSPDGRWLATSSSEYQLWEVGSWQPRGPPIRGYELPEWNFTAFSPDSTVMAITTDGHSIKLLETSTEKPLATLEAPWPGAVAKIQFSPDGTQIAALQRDQQVQLWDLRLVRQELQQMHLDWEMPPYPPLGIPVVRPAVALEIAQGSTK